MKKYRRPAAVIAALIGGIYGILLIAAAAAPAPTLHSQKSQSSVVADHLAADAALLAHPSAQPKAEAPSP